MPVRGSMGMGDLKLLLEGCKGLSLGKEEVIDHDEEMYLSIRNQSDAPDSGEKGKNTSNGKGCRINWDHKKKKWANLIGEGSSDQVERKDAKKTYITIFGKKEAMSHLVGEEGVKKGGNGIKSYLKGSALAMRSPYRPVIRTIHP